MAKVATYASLRSAVRKMLRQGDEAGVVKRVARYYSIGEMIDTHVVGQGGKPEYGKEVIQRLADDLQVGNQRLYEMLNVRRAYRISRPAGKLSWTHYVALASIEDDRLRVAYESHATRGAWSRRQLRDRIREGLLEGGDGGFLEDLSHSTPPTPRRGVPFTYRVKEATQDRLLLDVGMGAEHGLALAGPSGFEPGDIVMTKRDGSLYQVEEGERANLYTFAATVSRVVDGDTFWVKVDYGFEFYQPWKVRLRGVDAPELPTEAGVAAKVWVEERLGEVPFIVMTTTKVGMFGRYIADVFFGADGDVGDIAGRGRYLNGEMVEAGVALRA
jgi:endonuclease YncB( thermonuclease family)